MFLVSQSNEFLIVILVAVIIVAVALIIYFIVTGRKKKEDIKISPNFESKATIESVDSQEEKNILEIQPVKENNIIETEDKIAEDAKTDNSIQTLLSQMQQDLDSDLNKDYSESISRYEDEEEATAIISYKELMKYKEEREKEIVLEEKDKDEIKEVLKEKVSEEPPEEVKKFKRSEFISPIFGYNDEEVTYREIKRPERNKEIKMPDSDTEWESDKILKDLENDSAEVMEFEDDHDDIAKDNENEKFLNALVDFRSKLN